MLWLSIFGSTLPVFNSCLKEAVFVLKSTNRWGPLKFPCDIPAHTVFRSMKASHEFTLRYLIPLASLAHYKHAVKSICTAATQLLTHEHTGNQTFLTLSSCIHIHILPAPSYNTLSTQSMHINRHYTNHKITQTGSPALSTDYISITKWSAREKAVDPPRPHFFLSLALCYYLGFPALVIKVATERQRQIIWWVGWLGRSARGHYLLLCFSKRKDGRLCKLMDWVEKWIWPEMLLNLWPESALASWHICTTYTRRSSEF